MGARRDEEGVQVVGVAIERFVAGQEFDADGVLAGVDGGGGNHDVAVDELEIDGLVGGVDGEDAVAFLFEIEHDFACGAHSAKRMVSVPWSGSDLASGMRKESS